MWAIRLQLDSLQSATGHNKSGESRSHFNPNAMGQVHKIRRHWLVLAIALLKMALHLGARAIFTPTIEKIPNFLNYNRRVPYVIRWAYYAYYHYTLTLPPTWHHVSTLRLW